MPTTYAEAGVSITEGERLVEHIKSTVKSTYSKSVLGDIGAFGAFYDARFRKYKRPVLVTSVDGVGTKLLVAQLMNRHDTVGEDLVNHCVNDILVCGATPLYFLDYFATGKLKADVAAKVISGFVRGCKENDCALIGGETAEMPGMYKDDEYDLAGTIVGVVERKAIVNGAKIRKGDVLVGIPSSGLHTNGYSLTRAVLLKRFGVNDHVPELGTTVGDALLAVHKSYLAPVKAVLKKVEVRGLSHITGGGIVGNTMRVVPKGLELGIDWSSWDRPPLFRLIQETGNVPEEDMRRTFNLGIGLVMIVPRKQVKDTLKALKRKGEMGIPMGEVVVEGRGNNGSLRTMVS